MNAKQIEIAKQLGAAPWWAQPDGACLYHIEDGTRSIFIGPSREPRKWVPDLISATMGGVLFDMLLPELNPHVIVASRAGLEQTIAREFWLTWRTPKGETRNKRGATLAEVCAVALLEIHGGGS